MIGMNANKIQKFSAVFAIALMIASIFSVTAFARSGIDDTATSGSSGSFDDNSVNSGGRGAGSLEDDIVNGDLIRGRGDENEIRGRENEVRGRENEVRGRGLDDGLSCQCERHGRGGDDSGSGERLEITSDSFGGSTEAKVKLDFVTNSASEKEIENEILERLKLDNNEIESMLVMDDDMEDMVERTRVNVKEEDNGHRVRFETKFPLNSDDRTVIVEGITAKLNSFEQGDIDSNGILLEKAEGNENSEVKESEIRKRGFLDDLSDMLSGAFGAIFGTKKSEPEQKDNNDIIITPEQQAAAGIIITGGVSGPGYPTGPLNMDVPSTQLILDRVGQVKQSPGQLEVKDRQYEVEFAAVPVTINGVANTATEVKVISNLKAKNGVGQHQGIIDVDIDTIPGDHVTLQYSGTAAVDGANINSKGTFKTAKTTGIFAGLVAEGTYTMIITETGSTFGSPAIVTISTISS